MTSEGAHGCALLQESLTLHPSPATAEMSAASAQALAFKQNHSGKT
jgi:hypothetical protein